MQDPEALKAASRPVMIFVLLMLATLVVGTFPLPWMAAAAVFAVASVAQGILALRSVWRAGARGALLPVLIVGLTFACMSVVSTMSTFVFWDEIAARDQCTRDALTLSAEEDCQTSFQEAMRERVERGLGVSDPTR